MKNIVWLASYPKSGNTWFRAFLANLLHEKQDPADINQLGGGPIFSSRRVFDNTLGIQSSDLLADEIDQLRPEVYKQLSKNATDTLFIKAHDAYTYLPNKQPLFPTEATRGAIYLLRNPLDVAPSFANHSSCGIDKIIRTMNDETDSFCGHSGNLANQLRQQLLGWSGHVESWLNAKDIDVHFVRYEDMNSRPLETFRAAIQFAGLSFTDDEIIQALDACSFKKLQAQEQGNGFREKAEKVNSFFRKGMVGSWQESLSLNQAKTLLKNHAQMIKQFNYIDNDDHLTFVDDIAQSSRLPILHQLQTHHQKTLTTYQLYGLSIALPFYFEELSETEHKADVTISLQSINCDDIIWEEETICYKAKPGLYLLAIKGIARYLIKAGQEIVIDIDPNADLDAVKLMLLSPVIGILLIQRGLLPFWGSCVIHQGKAYALLGHSSTGKSFLAAGLKQKGFQVLSDNLCVLDTNRPLLVYPGYPFLMLWKNGVLRLNESDENLKPVRKGLKKYIYPLNKTHCNKPVQLAGIYLLSSHNKAEFNIDLQTGFQSLFELLAFTYNEPLIKTLGMIKQRYKISVMAVKTVPIKRYRFLDNKDSFQQSIDFLAQDIKSSKK